MFYAIFFLTSLAFSYKCSDAKSTPLFQHSVSRSILTVWICSSPVIPDNWPVIVIQFFFKIDNSIHPIAEFQKNYNLSLAQPLQSKSFFLLNQRSYLKGKAGGNPCHKGKYGQVRRTYQKNPVSCSVAQFSRSSFLCFPAHSMTNSKDKPPAMLVVWVVWLQSWTGFRPVAPVYQ